MTETMRWFEGLPLFERVAIETLCSYTSETRAVDDKSCLYLDIQGHKCALGRCIDPQLAPMWVWNRVMGGEELEKALWARANLTLDAILYEEYRGLFVSQWMLLQELHDMSHYWNATGPSKDANTWISKHLS